MLTTTMTTMTTTMMTTVWEAIRTSAATPRHHRCENETVATKKVRVCKRTHTSTSLGSSRASFAMRSRSWRLVCSMLVSAAITSVRSKAQSAAACQPRSRLTADQPSNARTAASRSDRCERERERRGRVVSK